MARRRPRRAARRSSTSSPPTATPIDGAIALDELLAAEPGAVVDVEPDDLAVLMFTSGTAGSPRAAMLTPRQPARQPRAGALGADDRVSADDVVYGVLPLFHIFGLNVVLGADACAAGATRRARRSASTRRPRSSRSATAASPSCPARRRCGRRSRHFDEAPGRRLRHRPPGARPARPSCPSSVRRAIARALRRSTSPRATGSPRRRRSSPSSAGLPPRLGSVGARARRRRGAPRRRRRRRRARRRRRRDLGAGARTCSPATATTPRRPARVLTADGWLRTGDIAVVDDDGYLYLVDRAKDLIIVSGFNVFPAEVEEVLAEPPGRRRGRRRRRAAPAHRRGGQGVRRARSPASALDEDDVIDFCPRPPRPLQVPEQGGVRRRAARGTPPASSCAASSTTPATADRRIARRTSGRTHRRRCFVNVCTSGLA